MTSFSQIEVLEEQSRYKEGIYYNLPTDDPDRPSRMKELKELEKTIFKLKSHENAIAKKNGQKGVPYPEIYNSRPVYRNDDSFICQLL